MNFISRVLLLIEQKGISKNKMLSDLKLGKNSFVNWQERGTIPNGETLSKISNYFNVSIDYLLGNEQIEKSPSISDEDIEICNRICKLNSEDKDFIIKMIDKFIK